MVGQTSTQKIRVLETKIHEKKLGRYILIKEATGKQICSVYQWNDLKLLSSVFWKVPDFAFQNPFKNTSK